MPSADEMLHSVSNLILCLRCIIFKAQDCREQKKQLLPEMACVRASKVAYMQLQMPPHKVKWAGLGTGCYTAVLAGCRKAMVGTSWAISLFSTSSH